MKPLYRILPLVLLMALPGLAHAQSYEEYRQSWRGLHRARFITFRYDRPDLDIVKRGYVSDRPLEWSRNLGGTGDNILVDPFTFGSEEGATAKHVLIMVHGYGMGGILGGYHDAEDEFSTEFVHHHTGTASYFHGDDGPALYTYLRSSAPTAGFDPAEWVILGVTLDITQGAGLSLLHNQARLRALMDLLWHHKKEQIRTISFVSHSTGGPIVKGVLSNTDATAHPWLQHVDDHINLAGALGGTPFVVLDVPAGAFASDLRHQLMYGIQHPGDVTDDYTYFAGRTAEQGTFKRTRRWPAHINVLSVAGVWDDPLDGNPYSGTRVGLIPWNGSNLLELRWLNIHEGKSDGVVPSMSVLESVQYKQLDPILGDPHPWRHQVSGANRYGVDYSSRWTLPALGSSWSPLYTGGAGAIPLGTASNADNVPAADRFRGEKVTYVEVGAQHNGMLHNEHLLRTIRRRLGTHTVTPHVERPRVTGLSQHSGPLAGGNTVEIHGSGFRYVTDVRFGDVSADAGWTVHSDTRITVQVPAAMARPEGDTRPYVVRVAVVNTAGASAGGADADYRYLPAARMPTVSPEGGTFSAPPVVTMATETPGATIYYTLDGSEPLPGNPAANVYAAPITIAAPLTGDFRPFTLRARAVAQGFTDSPVASATFTVEARVAAPTVFPEGGDFTGSASVTLGTATPGAYLYYTTDGSEPTYNSTRYTGPIRLGVGDHEVKARAYRIGYNESVVSSARFRVYSPSTTRVDDPILVPYGSGQFTDSVVVRMDNYTEGARIHYTIGRNEAPPVPTEQSPVYTGPFTLRFEPADVPQGGTTWYVRAKSFHSGLPASNLVQRSYAVSPPLGTTEAPAISPAGGTFHNAVSVTVSSGTQGARLYLTTDGSTPTYDPNDRGRDSPSVLNLNRNTTVRALAKRPFFSASGETAAAFIFQSAAPTITAEPLAGRIAGAEGEADVFVDSLEVRLSTETLGAVLRYTLDGAEPGDDAPAYDGPIRLARSATVTARAFRPGYLHSDVVAQTFVVQQGDAPVVTHQPESRSVEAGEAVVFTVRAAGTPPPSIQWQFEGQDLGGATSDTLRLPSVGPADAGTYRAIVRNVAGADTSAAATLLVLPAERPPEILTQPDSQRAPVGAVVTFSVVASAKPPPTYQWLKDGTPIAGADTSTLTLRGVRPSDEGSYAVVVRNVAGSDTSRGGFLTVAPAEAPQITAHPMDVRAAEGDTIRFTARAQGQPAPFYLWLHEGRAIPGAMDTVLVLEGLRPEDAGTYAFVAFNLAGLDTSRVATLTVGTGTSVDSEVPLRFSLHENRPNPVRTVATIRYGIPRPAHVTLEVFDLLGRRVLLLTDEMQPPGWHTARFDGAALASGVYLYRLTAKETEQTFSASRSLVVVR